MTYINEDTRRILRKSNPLHRVFPLKDCEDLCMSDDACGGVSVDKNLCFMFRSSSGNNLLPLRNKKGKEASRKECQESRE